MTELDKLKKIRAVYRTTSTKLMKQVTQLWESDLTTIDTHQIDTLQNKLEAVKRNVLDADKQVLMLLDVDETEADCQRASDIQEAIIESSTQLMSMRTTITASPVNVPHDASQQSMNGSSSGYVHMPKLHIRKFDGDPICWQTFWDSFNSAVHSKSNIQTIDKFNYLVSFLDGDAFRVIEGYRITEANYQSVIDALTERFGDKELAIFAHFDKLLALPSASTNTQSLQSTYDETEKHIRSLVALGLEEDTFGRVFSPIILSKLPRQVRIELHRYNGCKPWNLATLRDLLHSEIKARQLGELSLEQQQSRNVPTAKPAQRTNYAKPASTVQNLTRNSKPAPNCIYCGDLHYSSACPKYTSSSARYAHLKTKRVCFKCLSDKHMVKACTSTKPCFYCKSKSHHSSLCMTQFPSPGLPSKPPSKTTFSRSTNPNDDGPSNSGQTLTSSTSSPQSINVTVMQTATIHFSDKNISARVYFDSGSSRSYITTSLARNLHLSIDGSETISSATFGARQRHTKSYNTTVIAIPATNLEIIEVPVLVTDTISCPIQRVPISAAQHPILDRIRLADHLHDRAEDAAIDILIGADFYYRFVNKERIDLDGGLVLLDSKLGYIVTGPVPNSDSTTESCFVSTITSFHNHSISYQNQDIQKLWKLEEIGIKEEYQHTDDDSAMDQVNKSIIYKNGRYQVGWPWPRRMWQTTYKSESSSIAIQTSHETTQAR